MVSPRWAPTPGWISPVSCGVMVIPFSRKRVASSSTAGSAHSSAAASSSAASAAYWAESSVAPDVATRRAMASNVRKGAFPLGTA